MTTFYPQSVDTFATIPSGTRQVDPVGSRTHRQSHNDMGDVIEALQREVGPLASGLAGLSPLLNGGMDVWQDGTTFTSIANGAWGPDNWIYAKSGAVVHDLLRSTDVPTVASALVRATYSLHLDVTTADSSIAAGDFCAIATRMEGVQWRRFDQQIWSVSFWVKSSITGIYYVYARNAGNDRSCLAAYQISAADTWEQKSVAFPANPTTGTWDYANGRGIEIGWTLAAGSTYQTTAGTWQTGDYKAGSDQANAVNSTANNFRLAMVGRPTIGIDPHRWQVPDPGLELYRLKRYHEVFGGSSLAALGSGTTTTTTIADVHVPIVPKRSTSPSIAVGATIGNLAVFVANGSFPLTAVSALSSSEKDMLVRCTVASGLTAGQGVTLIVGSGTSETLKISSRLP